MEVVLISGLYGSGKSIAFDEPNEFAAPSTLTAMKLGGIVVWAHNS